MAPHILIIDADANAARVTSAGIRRVVPEATVVVATDTEAGWLSLQRQPPDVLVIDPPRHSLAGTRLIARLKVAHPEAHVIVLASASTPGLRRDLEQLGVHAYLEKPALLARLNEVLGAVVQRWQLRASAHRLLDAHGMCCERRDTMLDQNAMVAEPLP